MSAKRRSVSRVPTAELAFREVGSWPLRWQASCSMPRSAQELGGFVSMFAGGWRLASRLSRDLTVATDLLRQGVDPRSVLLFPIRRRTRRVTEIRLRSGVTLRAPRHEPLPFLFREIWVDHAYGTVASRAGCRVVVDIGAHVGVFAIWAATQPARPRVIAVEPGPRALEFLAENVRINRLDNVTIVRAACGARDGAAILYLAVVEMMNSLYEREGASGQKVSVPMLTLDELFRRHRIERCDLLKIDCEGAEFEILLGGCSEGTLRKVASISMEFHRWAGAALMDQLIARLERMGFSVGLEEGSDPQHGYLRATREALRSRVAAEEEAVAVEAGVPA